MKKVLFFTTTHYSNPSAVGISVNEIIKELQNREYEIHLICYRGHREESTELIDGVYVYRINMPIYYRLNELSKHIKNINLLKVLKYLSWLLSNLKILMYLPFFPVKSIITIIKFLMTAIRLQRKHKFRLVISSYNPIEGLIASNLLKKIFGDFRLILYALDSLTNYGGGRFLSANFTDKMGWKWEKRLYKNADLILNMETHKKHYNQRRYKIYSDKIKFVDIPLLTKSRMNFTPRKKDNHVNFVYSGSLYSSIRNPEYACELFKAINNENYRINFYSQGDCEQKLAVYQNETKGMISRNGYISHEEMLVEIDRASFLINIGNKNSDMIPSKIFEYMSTGKPIIHFYHNENDSSIPYLRQYSLALLVKQEKELTVENISLVKKFIIKNTGKRLSFEAVEKLFKKNTPDYTVNAMTNIN